MGDADALVIVGGGPAGLSVARGYRAAGGTAPVTLLAGEPHAPYRRPPLTKDFLRGRVGADELPIEADALFRQHDVDLRRGAEVAALHPGGRRSSSRPASCWPTGSARSAPARSPSGPRYPAPTTRASTRSGLIEDSAGLAATMRAGLRAVVIGSGFIGCEAAALLAMRGVAVTVVTPEDAPQSERLGAEVGARLRAWLEEAGIEVVTGVEVTQIGDDGGAVAVVLDDGREVPCDRAALVTGARPRTGLAEAAGIRVEDGAVPTDERMRSSAEGVRCAGDIALVANPTAGRRLRVEHWGEALAQGEVAGALDRGETSAGTRCPASGSTIGLRTLKQAAWGDGWDEVLLDADAGGFTSWYGREGRVVGVLTHQRDRDYDRGSRLVAEGAPWPPP